MYIDIYTLGGTIDKVYYDAKSDYRIGEPYIAELLPKMNVRFDYGITSIMKKDSLEMTATDREKVRQVIKASKHSRILITHGTDTMSQSSGVLSDIENKTIVLTGAMQPARFHETDAQFNLAFALGALQLLDFGIYICMHGRIFKGADVDKNRQTGSFEGRMI